MLLSNTTLTLQQLDATEVQKPFKPKKENTLLTEIKKTTSSKTSRKQLFRL